MNTKLLALVAFAVPALSVPAFAQTTPVPVTGWDQIYELFDLGSLQGIVGAGIAVLAPITIAMVGYAIFRRMSKQATRA